MHRNVLNCFLNSVCVCAQIFPALQDELPGKIRRKAHRRCGRRKELNSGELKLAAVRFYLSDINVLNGVFNSMHARLGVHL